MPVAQNIIEGAAVLTIGDAKGHGLLVDRTTLEQVLEQANAKTGGVKFKEDHGGGVMTTIGVARNFRIEGDVLRADLEPFESYKSRDQLMEMAETFPEEIGLSINFMGPVETIGSQEFARCTRLLSVDLVDNPAANPQGLFSERIDNQPENIMNEDQIKELVAAMIAEAIKPVADSVQEMSTKFADYEKQMQEGEKKEELEEEKEELEEVKVEMSEKITALEAKLEELPRKFAEFLGVKPGSHVVSVVAPKKDDDQPKLFAEIVADNIKAGMTKTDAISKAIQADPKAYQFARENDGLRSL